MKHLLKILLLVVIFSLLFTSPALAMDEPTDVDIYDVVIFEDLLADGDFLAIVPYMVSFNTTPDYAINKAFYFQIISPDGGTVNGTALAYPKETKGYGYGIVSFYFESGMTWGAAYKFRVAESPVYYPSPQYWDFAVGPANYSDETDQSAALKAKIIDEASTLGSIWDEELLTTNDLGLTILSTYGELYFINAVPGLQAICPTLFGVEIVSPSYTKRSWTYTLADSMMNKYSGTIFADFMTGYAGLFSMQESTAATFISIIIFVAFMMLAVFKLRATVMSSFIDGYAVLLLLMLLGAFNMVYAGILAFASVFLGGVVLFLNRS